MTKWTKQQNDAIFARNRNILVSAAAGSGKTAVLVERVIRLITDENNPVDIDKLLIVTFTNAAAQEMKSRIALSLEKIIKNDFNNSNALRQMSLLSSSKICTIDSFCLNLVKENFFELDINQDFKIMDEAEANILAQSAIDTVLDNYFDKDDKKFLSLVEFLSSPKDDKAFAETIKKIHTYIYAQPFPFEWLNSVTEFYNPSVSLENSVWYDSIINELKDGLNCGKELIESCFELLEPDDELYEGYTDTLNDDLRIYNYLIDSLTLDWNGIINAFKNISFGRIAFKRGYTSPVKADLNARRLIYKSKIIDDLKKLFCASAEDYKSDLEILYPILKKLCEVVIAFDNEFLALKKERNGYTFSDIEHFAIKLLVFNDEDGNIAKTELAKDLQDSFYEILVDEYQDTNEAQDLLFKMLSNGNNRFMVGDVKQSIYRFRIAMPFIFTAKKNAYAAYNKNDDGISSKIILDKNFRSKSEICDYVNYVFSAFMTKKTGELDYDESEYLNYGADFENNDITCAQVKILTDTDGADFDKKEAIYIAKTIKKKIDSKELVKNKYSKSDNDKYRPIQYGDFAILLRSVKNHIAEYNEVFSSLGIPTLCDNSGNLFDNSEIQMLLSLMRVIDNPMQDIPLLSVMMSPLYGFTADEMAQIKLEKENLKLNLYSSVVNSKSQKVHSFLNEIDMFGKMVVTMSVASFIRFICDYKSVYAFANALGNGQQRLNNINKFIEYASMFDNSDSVGLTSFMRFIDKVIEGDRGIESASLNSSSENAVSIMSVHHSKGLEFPVVILAGASRIYNMMDLSSKLLLNPFKGIGVKIHNENLLYQCDTIPYTVIKNLNKNALISENLRVLYVAMTRAKEQFISFITVKNLESKIEGLSAKISNGKINPYLCKSINSDADFLLMSALMHQNAGCLRTYTDINVKTVSAPFNLEIEIINSIDDIDELGCINKVSPSESLIKEIENKLSYKYENNNLSAISAKRNASSLDESIKNLDFFASSRPAFMEKDGITPGERGTAMHTFMQFCNYKNAKLNLDEEIERLFKLNFIDEKQKKCLNKEALSYFFNSEFALRMFCSKNIFREIKVTSFVEACEIEETDSNEKILVQGIADCVFEENDKLVLVDYKTDKVHNEKQLLEMYKNQIAFYVKAVSKTLKKDVKEAVLYSFHLGKPCYYEIF